jgi:hypothetical protein
MAGSMTTVRAESLSSTNQGGAIVNGPIWCACSCAFHRSLQSTRGAGSVSMCASGLAARTARCGVGQILVSEQCHQLVVDLLHA